MTDTTFDLQAYLHRIGYRLPVEPNLATLRGVVLAHVRTIPFENIDVLLGRPPRLDLGSLQLKLVHGRRGGYCFEQNGLLLGALQTMGFRARALLGRVVRGLTPDAATPRTHACLLVELPEGRWLVDVGFGNLTPTAPLALIPDLEQPTTNERYRLVMSGTEHVVQARLGEAWASLYRFGLEEVLPIDYEVSSWFTATHPQSPFVQVLVAARPGIDQRHTLVNGRIHARATTGGTQSRDIGGDYAGALAEFGLSPDPADLAALERLIAEKRLAGKTHPAFGA